MIEPRWITKAGFLILHEDSICEHGGAHGLRDEGLLESALARPRAAFAAMNLFLEKNGWRLIASEVDATLTMLKVAASDLEEPELAVWIEHNIEASG